MINKTLIKKGSKAEGTNTVYFNYRGYSIAGQKCFDIWSKDQPEKALIILNDNFINKLATI